MNLRYQVKQYVGRVEGSRCSFRVFETGDAKFWLFCQVDDHDCDTGLQFPVRKSDATPEMGWALRRGISFSFPAFRRFKEAGGRTRRGAPVLP